VLRLHQDEIVGKIQAKTPEQQRKVVRAGRLMALGMMVFMGSFFWFLLTSMFMGTFVPEKVFGPLLPQSIAFYLTCLLIGFVAKTGLESKTDEIEIGLKATQGYMQSEVTQELKNTKRRRVVQSTIAAVVAASLFFGYFMPFLEKNAVKPPKIHKTKKKRSTTHHATSNQ
jgi:hypothetical protein